MKKNVLYVVWCMLDLSLLTFCIQGIFISIKYFILTQDISCFVSFYLAICLVFSIRLIQTYLLILTSLRNRQWDSFKKAWGI